MSTIQDLEELILKKKEEKEPFDNRMAVINKRTTRALRDEENYITKVGEFEYTDGSPVKANTPYHIHYTSLLEEVYMTEHFHKSEMSKIIVPVEIKTDFQYYNSLNKQAPLKISGEYVSPTLNDYNIGFYTRHFAVNSSDERSAPFEINQKALNSSPLYNYVSIKWHLSGPEESVYAKNANEIEKAKSVIPNIDKILPRLQFYRYDLSLGPKELTMQKLGLYQPVGSTESSQTTSTDSETDTSTQSSQPPAPPGYSAGSGGPPPAAMTGGSSGGGGSSY